MATVELPLIVSGLMPLPMAVSVKAGGDLDLRPPNGLQFGRMNDAILINLASLRNGAYIVRLGTPTPESILRRLYDPR